jgi:hypothetical protein
MTPELIPCKVCQSVTNKKSRRIQTCQRCYNSIRATNWQRNNVEKHRYNQIKSVYGLEEADYKNLILLQNNLCAICNKPEVAVSKKGKVKNLAIDHCHTTGKIRGLLCQKCNTALGKLQEDKEILRKMIAYLEIHHG